MFAMVEATKAQVVDSMANLLTRMLRLNRPITAETTLENELGLSSSQSAQLVLELEQDLSIMIDVESLDEDGMVTVGDLADYIVTHSTPE